MNILFSRDVCAALVLTFGHFLWIGTLVAIVTSVVVRRWQVSRTRYAVWLTGLLVMAGSPIVTFAILQAIPTVNPADTEMVKPAPPIDSPSQLPDVSPANSEIDRHSNVPSRTNNLTREVPLKSTQTSAVIPVEVPKTPVPTTAIRESAWWRDYAPLVTSLYLIGVSLMGLRLLLGLWGGHQLRYQSELITQRWMLDALQRQADAMGLILVPAMAYCERVTVPTVLGILQPMILLPMTLASGLTPEQIESVLAHELAHLRRYDHLVNLLQCVIESLLFFHPAVWWLSRRVRDEREHCCDDLVIASGAVPLDYAASLLRVAELSREAEQRAHNQRRSFTAASLFATGDRPSTLRQRIARLLGYQTELHVRAVHSWVLFGLATCCVGAIGVLSSMTWNVLAEINRDHSQTMVIIEWSAMVDESVINEIRALKSNPTTSSTDTGTETIRCSAEELRSIIKRRLDQPKATTLGNRIGILRSRSAGSRRNSQVLSWNFGDTIKNDEKGPNPLIGWSVHGKCWVEEIQNAAKLGVEADIGSAGSYLHIIRKSIKFDEALTDGQAVAFAVSPTTSDSVDGFRADQWKPTLIFVYEACEVPASQVDLLNPVVRARDWIQRGASGVKLELARIAEWRSQATQEFATAHKPDWTRELPDGGSIELLGIGRPQMARLIWWDPSGHPISGDDPSWGVQFPNELTGIIRVSQAGVERRTNESNRDASKLSDGRDAQFAAVPIKKSDSNNGQYTLKVATSFGAWTAEGKVAPRDDATVKINGGEFRVAKVFDFSDRIFHLHCDWKLSPEKDIDVVAVKKDGRIVTASRDSSSISHDDAVSAARGLVFEAPLTEVDHLLVQTRGRHWIEFTGFATEPAVVSKPQQFVANLPNGMSVEFVGLAEMGQEDKNWWKPDGELLDQVPAHKPSGIVSVTGQEMRRTLIRVHGATSHLDVTTNMTGERTVETTDTGERYVRFVGGLGFAPPQKAARVEVGVATVPLSPWRRIDATGKRLPNEPNDLVDPIPEDITILSVAHPRLRALGDHKVNGSPVPLKPDEIAENDERQKQTEITFLPPVSLNRLDFQLQLIDIDGQTHTRHSSSYFFDKPEVRFTFNVPLDRVARFEYRLRPYQHWVTFDNVSVYPGKTTVVKLTVASLPTPKPPHYIANLPDGRSIEFVGITKNTAAANEGWKPDGRPIGDVGYWPATNYISGNTHGSFTENGEHPEPNAGAIDLLFRFRGLKAQPSLTFDLATKGSSYSHLPLKEPYELRISAERRDSPPPDSKWTIPDGEMRVGLTDEPWGKWLQISPTGEVLNPLTDDDLYRSYYEQIQIMRTEPHERAPNKLALVLRTPQEMSRRYSFEIRGIDPDEKSQWVLQWEGKGIEGTDLIEGRWGLATSETKPLTRFEFRLRPYRHWVTFTGVSAEPGKESDVKVKAESVNDDGRRNPGANNQTIPSTP